MHMLLITTFLRLKPRLFNMVHKALHDMPPACSQTSASNHRRLLSDPTCCLSEDSHALWILMPLHRFPCPVIPSPTLLASLPPSQLSWLTHHSGLSFKVSSVVVFLDPHPITALITLSCSIIIACLCIYPSLDHEFYEGRAHTITF